MLVRREWLEEHSMKDESVIVTPPGVTTEKSP